VKYSLGVSVVAVARQTKMRSSGSKWRVPRRGRLLGRIHKAPKCRTEPGDKTLFQALAACMAVAVKTQMYDTVSLM
jgi:hypothetical protein